MRRMHGRVFAWLGATLLILGSVGVPGLRADEFADDPQTTEFPDPNEIPPPKTLPDYAPRARFEGRFPWPTRSFSLFDSPVTYGSSPRERCTPELFSPRGIGVARRTSCERMDYSPYVTKHGDSSHGPSFYQREHLYPCHQPHHCEKNGKYHGWWYYY